MAHHGRAAVGVAHGHHQLARARGGGGGDPGERDGLGARGDGHGAQAGLGALGRAEGDVDRGRRGGAVGVHHEVPEGQADGLPGLDRGGGVGDRHAVLAEVRGDGAAGRVLGAGVVRDRLGVQEAHVHEVLAAGREGGVAVGGLGRVPERRPGVVGQERLAGHRVHAVRLERLAVDPHAGHLVPLRAGLVVGPGQLLGPTEGELAHVVPPVLLEGQLDGGARDVEVGDGVAERRHVEQLAQGEATDEVGRLGRERAAVGEAVRQQLGAQAAGVGHAEIHLGVRLLGGVLDGVAHPGAQGGLGRARAAGLPGAAGVDQLLVVGGDGGGQVGHDLALQVLEDRDGLLLDRVHLGGDGGFRGGLGGGLRGPGQQARGEPGDLAVGAHGQLDGGQVAAGGARLDHGAVGAAGRGVVLVELVGVGVEDDVHGGGGLADDAVELGPGRPLGGQLARPGGAVVVRGHDHVGGVLGLQLVRDRVHGGDLVEDLVALQARAGGGRVQLVGGGTDDRDAHAVDVEDGVRGEDGLLARRVHQVGGEHRELGPGLHTALQVVQALVELVVAGGQRGQAERVHHVDRRVVLLHVGHGLRATDQVAGAGQQRGAGAVLGLERGAVVLHGVRELRADVVRGQRAVEVVEGQDRDGGLVRGGRLDGQGGRRARGREDEDGAGGRGDGTAAEQAGHGSPRDA